MPCHVKEGVGWEQYCCSRIDHTIAFSWVLGPHFESFSALIFNIFNISPVLSTFLYEIAVNQQRKQKAYPKRVRSKKCILYYKIGLKMRFLSKMWAQNPTKATQLYSHNILCKVCTCNSKMVRLEFRAQSAGVELHGV